MAQHAATPPAGIIYDMVTSTCSSRAGSFISNGPVYTIEGSEASPRLEGFNRVVPVVGIACKVLANVRYAQDMWCPTIFYASLLHAYSSRIKASRDASGTSHLIRMPALHLVILSPSLPLTPASYLVLYCHGTFDLIPPCLKKALSCRRQFYAPARACVLILPCHLLASCIHQVPFR